MVIDSLLVCLDRVVHNQTTIFFYKRPQPGHSLSIAPFTSELTINGQPNPDTKHSPFEHVSPPLLPQMENIGALRKPHPNQSLYNCPRFVALESGLIESSLLPSLIYSFLPSSLPSSILTTANTPSINTTKFRFYTQEIRFAS